MPAVAQITDRAKRYRAQGAVTGKRVCVICGATGKLDVMHLDGNESHGEKANLAYGCRSCNGKLAAAFKRIGAGRPTNQYNPSQGVPSFAQYAWAVSNHSRGSHDEGGAVIHATPKHKRIEYAKRIASMRESRGRARDDERWNPAAGSAEVFEEFHGRRPSEVVTVRKKVHTHAHLAGLGKLTRLVVAGIDGKQHENKAFGGALLCCNEDKSQLFIEGGKQLVDLEEFGISQPHEMETLGKLLVIDYHTTKDHLGDEGGTAVYTHKLRTTNKDGQHVTVKIARYPTLIYDVVNEQLLISGGSYTIRAEGIDV